MKEKYFFSFSYSSFVSETRMQANMYNIYGFISQACAVQTLIWCLFLFGFSTESKAVYKRQVLSITSIAMAISLLGTLCMALYCRNKYANKHTDTRVTPL